MRRIPAMKPPAFPQLGVTVDGKPVVGGLFRAYATHGIPLDVMLFGLRERGALPCWQTFYREAVDSGIQPQRVLVMLDLAIVDVFGEDMRRVVLARLGAHNA